MVHPNPMTSFLDLHKNNKRANPDQLMKYKHSLLLYKLYNSKDYNEDWVALNYQHQFMNRRNLFSVTKTNNLRVGLNIWTNRLSLINGLIPLDWLNMSEFTYKVKCKEKFLS